MINNGARCDVAKYTGKVEDEMLLLVMIKVKHVWVKSIGHAKESGIEDDEGLWHDSILK